MILKRDHFILFGIMFYIFAASTFFDGSTAIQISRLVLVGIFAVVVIIDKSLKLNTYSIWLILFAAYSLFSCVYASNTTIAISGATTTIINAVTILSFVGLCFEVRDHNIKLILMKCLAIFPLILGIYIFGKHGIFCFVNTRYLVDEHYFNSNVLGLHSAIGFILAFWLLTQKKCEKNHRFFYIIVAVLNISFVALTASRKAIIIVALSFMLYYLFQSKSPVKFIGKVILIVAGVVLLWLALTKIPFLYDLGGNRLEQMINGFMSEDQADGSTSFRMSLIEWGFDWFKQKPFFGYGADNFRVLVGRMNTWAGVGGTYAHNNFIELLVDLGLAGFVIYYSMYVNILHKFIKSFRYRNMQKLVMGCVFISIFISEYGIVSYNDKYCQILYAIIWFIMISPDKEVNRIVQRADG